MIKLMEIALQTIMAFCAFFALLIVVIEYMLKSIKQNQREIKEEFKEIKQQFKTLVKNLTTQEIKSKKQ